MLKLTKKKEDKTVTIHLEGRLDTNTASQLDTEIRADEDLETLVLDMEKLDYISSAGLRVLLSSQKWMNKKGAMKIVNVRSDVMDIFDVTGFTDILDIE